MTAPTTDSTPDVVARAVAGDTTAIADLYREHRAVVFRFIYRRTANPVLAEDLTADVFVRVMKRINTFTWQGVNISAWILTIARNLVADYYGSGRYQREALVDIQHDDPLIPASTDIEAFPAESVAAHLDALPVLRLINDLAPDQRDTIIYRYLREFTLKETAAAMGKNESSIKALQFRAIRNMQRLAPKDWSR